MLLPEVRCFVLPGRSRITILGYSVVGFTGFLYMQQGTPHASAGPSLSSCRVAGPPCHHTHPTMHTTSHWVVRYLGRTVLGSILSVPLLVVGIGKLKHRSWVSICCDLSLMSSITPPTSLCFSVCVNETQLRERQPLVSALLCSSPWARESPQATKAFVAG